MRKPTLDLKELGIQAVDLAEQDLIFSEEEVWGMVKEMPSDMAPGPDGFTGAFFKSCWSIIKVDVMLAISRFSNLHASHLHWLNTADVALIPKKHGAEDISDYRPISLIHSIAKLLAKVLSTRLATVIHSISSPAQSAFLRS